MSRTVRFIRNHYVLGRCPRCMRRSFLVALGLSLAAAALYWISGGNGVVAAAAAFACSAGLALWLAHLAAFAWRATLGERKREKHQAVAGDRRTAVQTFGRAFVSIALATSLGPARSLLLANPEKEREMLLALACWDGKCYEGTFCCQWGDDAWCCQNGTTCAPSIRGCI
jgi:hypothetical protein